MDKGKKNSGAIESNTRPQNMLPRERACLSRKQPRAAQEGVSGNRKRKSSNEELTTLNEELQNRNIELTRTATDLNGLLNAVEFPIAILDNDLRLRHFTLAAEQLLNLTPSDVGRPISQIRTNLDISDLDQMASDVIKGMVSVEREVRNQKGHWYALRMRPYHTADNRIKDILVVLADIHDLKQYSTAIVETLRGSVLVLDSGFRVLLASPPFYRTFQLDRAHTEGRLLWELGNGEWNLPELRELLEKVLPEEKVVRDFKVERNFPTLGRKTMLLNARQLYQAGVGSPKILLVIEDITVRKAAEERNRELLGKLLSDREEESKRIARQLHDSFGPRLARLNLKVSELKGLISSHPELAEEIEEMRKEISDLAKVSHDLAQELHPAALSQLGLEAALEAECATFSTLCGTTLHFSAESIPESLSGAAALCLYRVAQESLENIRKHAQAKTASVTLAGKGQEIVMVVQDFGRGFDPHAARGGGLGLVSIEERVRLVNGSLSVKSKPGGGTQVEVRVPIGGI
jgi:signal transduction histidine kinase